MYKYQLLTLLLITGGADAANNLTPEIEQHINDDIALVHSVNEQTKTSAIPSFLGVGADQQCHYSTIQEALDAFDQSGVDEIRVSRNKTYNENLIIDDMDVVIVGGYLDCSVMSHPDVIGGPGTNQSLIDGNQSGSVIRIQNTSQRRNVVLKNLRLLHGDTEGPGGGLVAYVVDAKVSLINLDIRDNTAHYGAGIAIIAGDTDMSLQNSRVLLNSAKYAGGLYCSGGASSLVLIDKSGIIANMANGTDSFPEGYGGGVFLDGCYFAIYSGSATNGLRGIVLNSAVWSGGGIYARNSSTILINGHKNCDDSGRCIGDDDNPVNITSNSANAGGGISSGGGGSSSLSSSVTIFAGLIDGNTANYAGAISSSSKLKIGRLHQDCWDDVRCNYIKDNRGKKDVGAISGNKLDISSTYFEGNVSPFVSVIDALGPSDASPMSIRLEGNVFNHNGDDSTTSMITVNGSGEVEIIHNTIADNMASVSVIRAIRNGFSGKIPFLQIHSSIIDNPGVPILSHTVPFGTYTVNISAVLANETNSLTFNNLVSNDADNIAGGSFIEQIGSPLFVDRNNRNYHLRAFSPAIDYMLTTSRTTVLYKDMDYQDRGTDDPDVDDSYIFSYYDIGADEAYFSETIFVNGFEEN